MAVAASLEDFQGALSRSVGWQFERIYTVRRKGEECQVPCGNRLETAGLPGKQPRAPQPEFEGRLTLLQQDPELNVLGDG